MVYESIVTNAIEVVSCAQLSFCKFLSANDSGETGGHQSGILISKTAHSMLFTEKELRENHILKRTVCIEWQNDFSTESCSTWYESKRELRITRFGRGFPLLQPEYTGALFVLAKVDEREYKGYIFNSEEEIQQFLDAFGLTPAETNRLIEVESLSYAQKEESIINNFISKIGADFPSSVEMSTEARLIQYKVTMNQALARTNPDKALIDWTEEEYKLFRAIERSKYGGIITAGFNSVDDFISLANKVLNRRKSRAGKSLENHLSAIFDDNNVLYTSQGVTEGNKRPDFLFPSLDDYRDPLFPTNRLCTLAAKTTCKDRWRQVLNEADRLRAQNKFLCTLQQGISGMQMDEMQEEKVILVVPRPYISAYPHDKQNRIWTISKFIKYVQGIEGI